MTTVARQFGWNTSMQLTRKELMEAFFPGVVLGEGPDGMRIRAYIHRPGQLLSLPDDGWIYCWEDEKACRRNDDD